MKANIIITNPLSAFIPVSNRDTDERQPIFIYNLIYDKAPQYLQNFMPNNSRGVDYYPIRNPRWQPPMHVHTFITGTCRYQLPMILNDLNSNDNMSEVIKNINNVSLLGFKRIVKTFLLDRYSFTCNIPNCYVCG